MGDRKPSSFFRSLLSSATSGSRRKPATRPAPAPPATTAPSTTPAAESKNDGQSTATPASAAIQTPPLAATTSSPPATTSPPPSEPQKAELSRPKSKSGQPQTSSPSRVMTPPPSSLLPASPSRQIAQSKSPPQSSPPSKPSPQAQSMRSSPSSIPSTPKKASQLRSPKPASSSSPKGVKLSSPPKVSLSKDEGAKPAASQTEEDSQPKASSCNGINHHTMVETSFKHDEVETKPPIELHDKTEEIKELKEVAQEPNTAEIVEKAEIPKPDKVQTERQDDTEKAAVPIRPDANSANTTYQPKKRGKTALPCGEHVPLHKDIRHDISTFMNRKAIGEPKGTVHDRPVSIITLAGENRGASMQLGPNSSHAEGPVHINRGYKINPYESTEAMTDGEGMKLEDADAEEHQPEAYVNNNVQGINNAIAINSSITERNPGVHMVVAHGPKESVQSTCKTTPTAQKAEVNMAQAEKVTYEPVVRRRCLRGLFLESSDSDVENPEKPRRHGCRVSCQHQSDKGDSTNVHSI